MSNNILDSQIRREAQLQRFASFMVREYVNPVVADLQREIPIRLIGFEDLNRTEQNQLFARIRQLTRESWGGIWVGVDTQWPELMESEADYQFDLYDDYAPETLVPLDDPKNARVPPMIVNDRAGTWAQFTAANVDDTVRQVDFVVRRGVTEGLTLAEITRELRGNYNRRTQTYSGGILDRQQRSRAESLVRTGVSHYTNAIRDDFAQQNDDVIQQRIFFATLDERTTTICMSNHLKRWDIDDDSYPRLPLHYNERSVYIFKTEGFDPLNTTRRVRGGDPGGDIDVKEIKANVSAQTWLKRQPRWFIEQTLGKTRAELFLDGNLSIKSMVDVYNQPLTLNQLRQTSAGERAYRKAGLNDG